MNRILLLGSMLALAGCGRDKRECPSGCDTFRTGVFDMKAIAPPDIRSIRRDSLQQLETTAEGDILYSITWLSPCQYELKQIRSERLRKRFTDNWTVTVDILETTDSSYTYESSTWIPFLTAKGHMTKVDSVSVQDMVFEDAR